MNLTLIAVSLNGQPLPQSISAQFGSSGGTIGRADHNTMALPDPDRHISRLQAEIINTGSHYLIKNVGAANPMVVGSRTLAPGESTTLTDRDQLRIGGYLLQVVVGSHDKPSDESAEATGRALAPAFIAPKPEDLDQFSARTVIARTSHPLGSSISPAAARLPDDFDPFAPPPPTDLLAPPAARSGSGSASFDDLLAADAPSSIDDVFGLRQSASTSDPLANFMASLPPTAGAGGAAAAPAADGLAVDPFAPSVANHTPDLLADFVPPQGVPAPRPAAVPVPPQSQAAPPMPFAQAPRYAGAAPVPPAPDVANAALPTMFDWQMSRPAAAPAPAPQLAPAPVPPAVPRTVAPGPFGAPTRPAPVGALDLDLSFSQPSPANAAPVPIPPPAAAPAMPTPELSVPGAQSTVPPNQADLQLLLQAFCTGAGIEASHIPALTPALMQDIGGVMRAAIEGTLQLIAVRAATKHELRADVTVIQARSNNPLKFAPDANSGIEQLLQPTMRGFLAGPAAMTDAMNDLVGHSIGTVAGMRSALEGMLGRFAPQQLESKLVGESFLDSLLPKNRKAKLWELYLQHFETMREEAQEDFHVLFGKAFLAAYEQQLERLQREGDGFSANTLEIGEGHQSKEPITCAISERPERTDEPTTTIQSPAASAGRDPSSAASAPPFATQPPRTVHVPPPTAVRAAPTVAESASTATLPASARRVQVFFGTDRAHVPLAARPGDRFASARGELRVGRAFVSIPPGHKIGDVERPSWLRLEFRENPAKHVVLEELICETPSEFLGHLGRHLAAHARPSAFIFVHGYNVSFESAALRTAQIAVDIGLASAPLFYSWPSQAGLAQYTIDESNAEWTRPNLVRFLELVADGSTAKNIVLIAHSMGSRPATWALERLLTVRPELKDRFSELVLAAPDIDAHVFQRDILPALAPLHPRVTLYASSRDRALAASKFVHGNPRLGDSGDALVVAPGMDTVDASVIETDFLAHSYLVSERELLMDLSVLLGNGTRAAQRSYLQRRQKGAHDYWVFPA
jgi:FHA domain-containing protein